MINARTTITQFAWVDIQIQRHLFRRALHGMAQPDLLNMRILRIHGPRIHRHRVDIVEHGRVRANIGHVFTNLPQMRDSPQGTHDPAWPQRIGDGLL
ncbi:hypothetical protein D3C72_1619740 [compost metagenome]